MPTKQWFSLTEANQPRLGNNKARAGPSIPGQHRPGFWGRQGTFSKLYESVQFVEYIVKRRCASSRRLERVPMRSIR